jgi:hypothetical protein
MSHCSDEASRKATERAATGKQGHGLACRCKLQQNVCFVVCAMLKLLHLLQHQLHMNDGGLHSSNTDACMCACS